MFSYRFICICFVDNSANLLPPHNFYDLFVLLYVVILMIKYYDLMNNTARIIFVVFFSNGFSCYNTNLYFNIGKTRIMGVFFIFKTIDIHL